MKITDVGGGLKYDISAKKEALLPARRLEVQANRLCVTLHLQPHRRVCCDTRIGAAQILKS